MKKIIVMALTVFALVGVPTAAAGFGDGGLHPCPINWT